MISILEKLFLYWNTLKYLKFEQIFYRLFYKLNKPSVGTPEIVNKADWVWSGINTNQQSIWPKFHVKFLSVSGQIDNQAGWNDSNRYEKLWLYNLHYFDDLNALGFLDRKEIHFEFIDKWLDGNAPCVGNGWEPYPLSLRLVNWVKWFSRQGAVESKYLKSIVQQSTSLSQQLEFHILGNHLFANAKALTFVGCFLDDAKGKQFLNLGLKLIDRELDEQFLADGAHFELSPMYHQILLWDLLELIHLAKLSQNPKVLIRVDSWVSIASKALCWLEMMIHPDGKVAFFNDTAWGVTPLPIVLCEYAATLDIIPSLTSLNATLENIMAYRLSSSGYIRVEAADCVAFLDCARVGPDYLPGHAHADTLSFEISCFGSRVFVNSGTSCYGSSPERIRQRGTAAHNTVEVDGHNSSEVWSGFRVARRAYPSAPIIDVGEECLSIGCSHDGYRRLKGKVTHSRSWQFKEQSLTITDRLTGKFSQAKSYFHLHPDIQVVRVSEFDWQLLLTTGEVLVVCFDHTCSVSVEEGTWHPEFGASIANKFLVAEFSEPSVGVTITW